jgi:hypothetical protein
MSAQRWLHCGREHNYALPRLGIGPFLPVIREKFDDVGGAVARQDFCGLGPETGTAHKLSSALEKNPARSLRARRIGWTQPNRSDQTEAAFGARLRELRWKNSAWLATAETIAGWNGFEIRNAGSGRSPVRKRSG